VWYKRGSTYIIAVKPQTGGPLPGGDGIVMSYSPQFTDQDSLGKYEQLLQTLHPRVLVQLYQQAGVIVVAGYPAAGGHPDQPGRPDLRGPGHSALHDELR